MQDKLETYGKEEHGSMGNQRISRNMKKRDIGDFGHRHKKVLKGETKIKLSPRNRDKEYSKFKGIL